MGFIRKNKQALGIYSIWILTGVILPVSTYLIIPFFLFSMVKKEMYKEILFGFLLILTLSDSRNPSLQFSQLIKDLYLIIMLFFIYKKKEVFFPFNKYYLSFIPFFFVAGIALFFSETPILGFQKTISYLLLLIVIPNYLMVLFRKEGLESVRFLIISTSLIIFAGYIFRFINPSLVLSAGRYSGVLGNPNGLGLFVFLFLVFFISVSGTYPNLFSRKEKLFILIPSIFSIVDASSRSSLIALVVFFILSKAYRVSNLVGFASFLLLIFIYIQIEANFESIVISLGLEDYFRLETLKEGSGRFVAWRFAWVNILENFFLGKGFSYSEWLFSYYEKELNKLGHQGTAHNAFLTFWLDTGIIGLICFFSALISKFFLAAKNSPFSFPILFSVLFSITFESWLVASLNPFTIQLLFSLIFLIYPINQREEVPVPVH